MTANAAVDSQTETREAILVAALGEFSQNGFDGTSTRDIVTRAGVNHGLIRYHFGSKEKLWRAAVDRAFERLGEGVQAALSDSRSDRERIGALVRGYVHFVARHPEFARLMHDEGKRRGPRMRWMVDRHVKPLFEAVSALLASGIGSGLIASGVSAVHFFYIFAGATGLIYHQSEECRRLSGVDPFDAAAVEAHARTVELLLLGFGNDPGTEEREA